MRPINDISVLLTGLTKCQTESQSRSSYFNEVQRNCAHKRLKRTERKVLYIFSVWMKTLHWNGSDTENFSCSNQYVLSSYSMGSSKEMLSMQSGWGLHSLTKQQEKSTNKTRHSNRMAWKNKCCRRWGRGAKSNIQCRIFLWQWTIFFK